VPIKSFRHKGLERFFVSGSRAGIQPAHGGKLILLLTRLNLASEPNDMNAPGFDLHALRGDRVGRYAVSVNGNWRLTFEFAGTDAILVDYEDYH
jgi:proteic killer suppression protein